MSKEVRKFLSLFQRRKQGFVPGVKEGNTFGNFRVGFRRPPLLPPWNTLAKWRRPRRFYRKPVWTGTAGIGCYFFLTSGVGTAYGKAVFSSLARSGLTILALTPRTLVSSSAHQAQIMYSGSLLVTFQPWAAYGLW